MVISVPVVFGGQQTCSISQYIIMNWINLFAGYPYIWCCIKLFFAEFMTLDTQKTFELALIESWDKVVVFQMDMPLVLEDKILNEYLGDRSLILFRTWMILTFMRDKFSENAGLTRRIQFMKKIYYDVCWLPVKRERKIKNTAMFVGCPAKGG